jgi:hypothetical protein
VLRLVGVCKRRRSMAVCGGGGRGGMGGRVGMGGFSDWILKMRGWVVFDLLWGFSFEEEESKGSRLLVAGRVSCSSRL